MYIVHFHSIFYHHGYWRALQPYAAYPNTHHVTWQFIAIANSGTYLEDVKETFSRWSYHGFLVLQGLGDVNVERCLYLLNCTHFIRPFSTGLQLAHNCMWDYITITSLKFGEYVITGCTFQGRHIWRCGNVTWRIVAIRLDIFRWFCPQFGWKMATPRQRWEYLKYTQWDWNCYWDVQQDERVRGVHLSVSEGGARPLQWCNGERKVSELSQVTAELSERVHCLLVHFFPSRTHTRSEHERMKRR